MDSSARVVGRDAELAQLEDFIAALGGDFAAAMLVGEPGIGKTTIWEEGVSRARAAGATVLTARPVEAEAGLSFAALGDLLAPLPGSGLSTSLNVPANLDLPADVAALLFRVAQEAVRNTQRHAQAGVLAVRVALRPESVELVIEDDGRGFHPAAKAADGHVGLRLIADLAAEAGGDFTVVSRPDTGTVVRLEVALEVAR